MHSCAKPRLGPRSFHANNALLTGLSCFVNRDIWYRLIYSHDHPTIHFSWTEKDYLSHHHTVMPIEEARLCWVLASIILDCQYVSIVRVIVTEYCEEAASWHELLPNKKCILLPSTQTTEGLPLWRLSSLTVLTEISALYRERFDNPPKLTNAWFDGQLLFPKKVRFINRNATNIGIILAKFLVSIKTYGFVV